MTPKSKEVSLKCRYCCHTEAAMAHHSKKFLDHPCKECEALSVTLSDGETFHGHEVRELARLVNRRFPYLAFKAWERLMQSSCTPAEFERLLGRWE